MIRLGSHPMTSILKAREKFGHRHSYREDHVRTDTGVALL